MTPKKLENSCQAHKSFLHDYINTVKKNSISDLYTILNATLITNPYVSMFPKQFFRRNHHILSNVSQSIIFIISSMKFYTKNFYKLNAYIIGYLLYKFFYTPKPIPNDSIMIDVFFLIDKINQVAKFEENYFTLLYTILDKKKISYTLLPRLYGANKNPFKLIKLFQVLNNDKRNFLFEFEYVNWSDFYRLFLMILQYPFKTLRLWQNGKIPLDNTFNTCLLHDINKVSLDEFTRYIFGRNIAIIHNNLKIYSWSEFQAIDRSFNYGIQTNSTSIQIIACQLFISMETEYNMHVDDIDFEQKSVPNTVLVNGIHYLLNQKKINYKLGVSLRYEGVFSHKHSNKQDCLILGSYIKQDTQYILDSVNDFENITFKNHPAVNLLHFKNLPKNITISNENIYTLFENANIVIGTSSGALLEAVACGLSAIIIASKDHLTANPLVEYGKGKIWDIAFTSDDVKKMYNNLIKYRNENADEIQKIAAWYKENFFIEPTEENIVKAFELDKE